MAIVSISVPCLQSRYNERADMTYEYDQWGHNWQGLRSHATKFGMGLNSSQAEDFIPYGISGEMRDVDPDSSNNGKTCNHYFRPTPYEGPHDTASPLIFKVPRKGAVDSAILNIVGLKADGYNPAGFAAFRIYGVAADNLVTRYYGANYPMTYRREFHQRRFGYCRTYTADSMEENQEHTEAEAKFLIPVGTGEVNLDVTQVVNEIITRPGWKAYNRLCLCGGIDISQVAGYLPAIHYSVDYNQYGNGTNLPHSETGGNSVIFGGSWNKDRPLLNLTWTE